MKHFSPYILKAFGALLSVGHLLFALHFLASEDEKVYFRMIAYANIILMIARSSVDFLATFAGAESSVISGRFTIERGFFVYRCPRVFTPHVPSRFGFAFWVG